MIPTKLLTDTAKLPTRGSQDAAGIDLHFDMGSMMEAATDGEEYEWDEETTLSLLPGNRTVLKTGMAMAISPGHYGQIAPRSGLAVKKGLEILAGVIDADYRGEIMVAVLNSGKEPIAFKHHDRVAQMIILPCSVDQTIEVQELPQTDRGDGGFGSTGE